MQPASRAINSPLPQTLVASNSPMAAFSCRGGAAGEGEDDGCWVPYGPRHGLRRLPPPIPSLGRLARARTADGRLVISREGGAAHHRVCGRKAQGRLVLGVAGSDAAADASALVLRRWSHPLLAQDDTGAIDDDNNEQEAVPEEGVRPPPPSPAGSPVSVACSDGIVRAVSLGAMPTSLARLRA